MHSRPFIMLWLLHRSHCAFCQLCLCQADWWAEPQLQLFITHRFICSCDSERICLSALESNQADIALQLQLAAQDRAESCADVHIQAR